MICIGMNYAAHAAESGVRAARDPVVFLKTAEHRGGPVRRRPDPAVGAKKSTGRSSWASSSASAASYLASPADAVEYIAGYLVANDLSERDFQLRRPAASGPRASPLPRFTPLGPWLVPADEVDAGTPAPAQLGQRRAAAGLEHRGPDLRRRARSSTT